MAEKFWTRDRIEELLDWIASGKSINSFCKMHGKERSYWSNLVRRDPALADELEKAWKPGSFMLLDNILTNIERMQEKLDRGEEVTAGYAHMYRQNIDACFRLIGIWNSKFNPRLTVNTEPSQPLSDEEMLAKVAELLPKNRDTTEHK